jgi:hypothetical protein
MPAHSSYPLYPFSAKSNRIQAYAAFDWALSRQKPIALHPRSVFISATSGAKPSFFVFRFSAAFATHGRYCA